MWPDRVSNPGPLTYESGALPTVLRGLAPSLEPSQRDCSNDGSQHTFEGINVENYPKIIPFNPSYLEHCLKERICSPIFFPLRVDNFF